MTLLFAALTEIGPCQQPGDFGPFVEIGKVPADREPKRSLAEISGVVASRQHPGLLWVHGDHGGGANLVALRTDGTMVQGYRLEGAEAVDWEDIASGPGPDESRDYLYVGDIGNNKGGREEFAIVRIVEPEPPREPGERIDLGHVEEFRFRYPGPAPDAETLLIDPRDGTPYVVAKEKKGSARVFRYPMPLEAARRKTLELVAVIHIEGARITGGDVARSGSAVFLRSRKAIHRFERPAGQPLWRAFAGVPALIATGDQGQAEAVAVEPDGDGLITISEGVGAKIWRARRLAPPGKTSRGHRG